MFLRTSSPWKLKTFNRTSDLQNSRHEFISCRLLSCHVLSCRNLQNLTLGNWRRSLRTSGLQTSLALGSSESSSLECWRRSTELMSSNSSSTRSEDQSSEAGTIHQNFLSRVFRCFFGNSSEHADADDLLIRNRSSEALWIVFGLRMQLLMERLLLQNQNLFEALSNNHEHIKIDHSIKIFVIIKT